MTKETQLRIEQIISRFVWHKKDRVLYTLRNMIKREAITLPMRRIDWSKKLADTDLTSFQAWLNRRTNKYQQLGKAFYYLNAGDADMKQFTQLIGRILSA